jgi:hypothetical protein
MIKELGKQLDYWWNSSQPDRLARLRAIECEIVDRALQEIEIPAESSPLVERGKNPTDGSLVSIVEQASISELAKLLIHYRKDPRQSLAVDIIEREIIERSI